MIEEWRVIKDFPNYLVSNTGRVSNTKTGKELKQNINEKGYRKVSLFYNGCKKIKYVHRLVYEAFVGKIPEGMQVNHKDEIKDNNNISNLEIVTPKQNDNYGSRNIKISESLTKYNAIAQLDKNGNLIHIYNCLPEAAALTGINGNYICKCCIGVRKSVGDYIFKYV